MSTTTVSGLRDSTPLSGPSAASSDMNAEFYTTSTIVDAVNEFIRTAPPASISKTPLTQEHLETTTTMSTMFGAPTSSLTPHKVNVADLSHSLQHFGIVDYVVFVLMLVVCAVIGFYFGFIEKKKKKKKGNRDNVERRGSEALDYLVGGRKMKVFPVSLSLVASFISGISLLGTSTEIYVYGTQYAFILFTLVISGVISWYIFLPVFCNLQLTSTYEYFELRFSRRLRLFGASLFVLKALIWLPIAIYVPALTFSQVSGIDVHLITPIVIVICTFYTSVGGLKGVIWTDVVQSFIMYGTMVLLIVKGTIDLGGFGAVWQRNSEGGRLQTPAVTLDPTVRVSLSAVFLGGTLFEVQSVSINQTAVQRFMSLPSLSKVKRTLITFTIGLILLYLLCVYVGLMAFATFHDCDPIKTKLINASDQLVPLLTMHLLGSFPGLPGLFVSAVFSAALSSLSTLLNSLAAVLLEDFIKPNVKQPLGERAVALSMRLVVVIFGLSSIGLVYVVERLGLVMELSKTLQSVLYGPMLGIFAMGMLMPWVNEKSALTGCTISFAVMCWICANAQIAQLTGSFRHPKLPVSVEGCEYDFDMSHIRNSTVEFNAHDGYALYHISFLWYTFMGSTMSIVGANIAGLFFGRNNVNDVDERLLVPFVSRLWKKRREYQQVASIDKIELK